MKKKLIKIAVSLLVILTLLLLVVYNKLGSIVRTGVETIGPKATGAKVVLADVDISLFAGKAGLEGFVLGNPEGFKSESAFKLGEVDVNLDVGSVTDDTIIVKSILIDEAEITWEGWTGGNHKKIMENIEKYAGGSGKEEEKKESAKTTEPGKKVIIKDFKFQNSSIAFVIGGKQIAKIPFPDLHLTEIGSKENGQTIKETMKQMYTQIFSNLGNAVTNNKEMLTKEMAQLQAKGKEILEEGMDTLEKGEEVLQQSDLKKTKETVVEGVEGIKKGLGNIFEKK